MTKRKPDFIRGTATHRRTESDYMGILLDTVTLDDWREVVTEALQLAKQGNPQARAWLAQYLIGKAEAKAPTPLNVVVNQWSGKDPVAEELAKPIIGRARYPILHEDDDFEESINAAIAAELAEKLPAPETVTKPVTGSDSGESAAAIAMQLAK